MFSVDGICFFFIVILFFFTSSILLYALLLEASLQCPLKRLQTSQSSNCDNSVFIKCYFKGEHSVDILKRIKEKHYFLKVHALRLTNCENVLDILSPEDIERDIFEEKMEEQKIQELLTGEAELLEKGIVG